jgi:hypothetical protein
LQNIWNTHLKEVYLKSFPAPAAPQDKNAEEIIRVRRVLNQHVRLDGFAWAVLDVRDNTIQEFNGVRFFYMPESFPFSFEISDLNLTHHGDQFNNQPRRLFNNIAHYDLATDTWTHGAPNWETRDGFITGKIHQLDERHQMGTYQFNNSALDNAQLPDGTRGVCPGMRAYHYQTENDAILGILNSGVRDGGAHGNHSIQGGYRAQSFAGISTGQLRYIRQVPGAAANQEHFKWIAFQLPPDAASGQNANVLGTFLAHDTAGDYNAQAADLSAVARPCGDISQYFVRANDERIDASLGHETHIINVALERNSFNSATVLHSWTDYGDPVENHAGNYGAAAKYGRRFSASRTTTKSTEANSLKFETNILYEFGQKRYIIERDGKMIKSDEDYPGIRIDQNVVAGQSTFGARSVPVLRKSGRLIEQDEFHEQ